MADLRVGYSEPIPIAVIASARWSEGRATFGEALKRFARAAEGTDDAEVLDAWDDLDGAWRGWRDAAEGRPPERAV